MKGRIDLEAMLLASRRTYEPYFSGLTPEDRDRLARAVEVATTMRRIDALIYLHRLLRVWIGPHVLTTALMLSFLVIHIVQVVYFAAR
jgi:hypothetical protein